MALIVISDIDYVSCRSRCGTLLTIADHIFPHLSQPYPQSTINNRATVGVQSLTDNGGAVHAGQEDETRRNLAWLAGTSNRRRELLLCFLTHCAGNERGPHWSRRHRVDAYAFAYLLVGQAAGEGDDSTLCAGVVEQVGAADVGVDAGIVDDGAATFHVRKAVFGEVEVGVNVGVEGMNPLVPVGRVSRLPIERTGKSTHSGRSLMSSIMFW